MSGKAKCKILKQIRQEIAQKNDIDYVVSECRHKGDCKGTCPKCEEEVRYLEKELEKRRAAGKSVLVAGLAASLMVTATGCMSTITNLFSQGSKDVLGEVPYYEENNGNEEEIVLDGDVAYIEEQSDEYELEGYYAPYKGEDVIEEEEGAQAP